MPVVTLFVAYTVGSVFERHICKGKLEARVGRGREKLPGQGNPMDEGIQKGGEAVGTDCPVLGRGIQFE